MLVSHSVNDQGRVGSFVNQRTMELATWVQAGVEAWLGARLRAENVRAQASILPRVPIR